MLPLDCWLTTIQQLTNWLIKKIPLTQLIDIVKSNRSLLKLPINNQKNKNRVVLVRMWRLENLFFLPCLNLRFKKWKIGPSMASIYVVSLKLFWIKRRLMKRKGLSFCCLELDVILPSLSKRWRFQLRRNRGKVIRFCQISGSKYRFLHVFWEICEWWDILNYILKFT